MILPETDWAYVGERALLFAIGVGTAWNTYKGNQRSKRLDEIHAMSNSAMGVVMKALAQVTAAKAVITKDFGDIAMAEDALRDYVKFQARQPKPKKPKIQQPKGDESEPENPS